MVAAIGLAGSWQWQRNLGTREAPPRLRPLPSPPYNR